MEKRKIEPLTGIEPRPFSLVACRYIHIYDVLDFYLASIQPLLALIYYNKFPKSQNTSVSGEVETPLLPSPEMTRTSDASPPSRGVRL
jgi:hypothetical protein